MRTESQSSPSQKQEKPVHRQSQQQQQKAGRSGEGLRSVLPHLKADMRAKAEAKAQRHSD